MTSAPQKLQNYINGEFCSPSSDAYIDSYNPATGKVHVLIPDSEDADVEMAVIAATQAFTSWSKTTRQHRHDILMKVAAILESRLEEFAEAESRDQGKPVSLARSVDIPRAIYNFRYFAGKVLYVESKCNEVDGVALNYVHRMPVGVCGLISPWNLPLYLLTWKIAPALAFGNTAVCKPSEITSLTASMLCQVLKDAGLPRGVLNMVFGSGLKAGSALVSHPNVPLISFTGGTITGEKITTLAAPYHKKLSLELGGKNANIIFDDADLEKAVEHTIRSSFANQGEICLCGSRIFVHEKIFDEFIEKFVSKTKLIKVGDPSAPETNMGPLVSEQHLEKVLSYVKIGEEEGGTILHGSSERLKQEGYYMLPTIIATNKMNPMKCRVTQDEIFGPVVTVTKFSDEDTVIEWANGVKYGLSASIWTENGKRQRKVAEALRVGTVWVNCWMVRDLSMPFGGTKHSGVAEKAETILWSFTPKRKPFVWQTEQQIETSYI